MQQETLNAKSPSSAVPSKVRDYAQLLKPNLSMMVVFSSVIGYLMAPEVSFELMPVLVLYLGGLLVTGGANTLNQILEHEGDKLMRRTMLRPIPDGRMSRTEAWIIAAIAGFGGASLLGFYFNLLTGILSFISLLLYAFAYTPMKRVHPIAVLIGAIPGALPPLLGWVAATGQVWGPAAMGGWLLFLFQFFWQFPHYWAIGWVGYDEYLKAGISMLPSQERSSRFTGLQCMFYSIVLIPLALFPRLMHMCSNWGMWIAMAGGVLYFAASVNFYRKNDFKSAKQVMYASFVYLPLVLLALYFTKL
ncbi:heme o synthase [Rurimicrobium arvi]|uniref:Protoheme IX farnesyltransferase n=1 Tax=Rurimicrobium arvi TaxID=2049916 RepID=A0ABP8MR00_9BACT